jgi:large subunit ribosomal protein L22
MKNEFRATQKYLLESPRKLRLVVGIIKKMKPMEAIEKLPFVQKRAGADLAKVIKAAMANARTQGASDTDLVFKEIQIGEGPRLKRGRAASRGRYHPYKRRMSHIRVVLITAKEVPSKTSVKEVKAEDKKIENKAEVKEKKVTKKAVGTTEKKGTK